ncbi:hypothetical protein FHL15_000295 [Xylaria flabelliformis]|uniref:Uncharacterized protein n=1 Tax=Xylaria flabelliformis TaxID=2512241 RepID=A0A553IFH4_9PEZI|nr:hypothetical protein FHL15_000295 [Xylaria flabelliformis]
MLAWYRIFAEVAGQSPQTDFWDIYNSSVHGKANRFASNLLDGLPPETSKVEALSAKKTEEPWRACRLPAYTWSWNISCNLVVSGHPRGAETGGDHHSEVSPYKGPTKLRGAVDMKGVKDRNQHESDRASERQCRAWFAPVESFSPRQNMSSMVQHRENDELFTAEDVSGPVEISNGSRAASSNSVMLDRWARETSRNVLPVNEMMQQPLNNAATKR